MVSFKLRRWKLNWLFVACVVIPTAIAIIYFGLLASDVYISESRYVVRASEKPASSGLGLVLSSAGFSNANEEADAAKAFVESRDALRNLNKGGYYRSSVTRDHISSFDRFNGLGFSDSFERLYSYYSKHVKVVSDTATSISTLTVRAYTPDDARKINEQLLQMAEATVNRMNLRGREDMIQFARVEVDDAQARARSAGLQLAAYRNREGVVDPEVQATTQLDMISKLQDEAISTRAQLSQLRQFAPLNPQIESLENRSRSIEKEINTLMGRLAGGDRSLAASAVEYQKYFLEKEFADQQLAAALASLQEARNAARRQQVYVERISQPNMPDAAAEPRRIRGVLATLVIGLVAWGIASMLVAGVKEHAQ